MADQNPNPNHQRLKLNVGGKLFETTASTLQSGGPDSLLADLSSRADSQPIFIDRDPDIFSVLLSVLRSNRLPSTALSRFSLQELAEEAQYYGIEPRLRSSTSPHLLQGIDASVVATVRPAADAFTSSFSAGEDGSIWISHRGQISIYDSYLTYSATVRTHIDEITSIARVWPDIAAIGSEVSAGLHFYDLAGGRHVETVHWSDPTDPRVYKARVSAITDSADSVFASFCCPHRENCVLTVDKSTLKISSELGRQSGSSAKNGVAGKLRWIPEMRLLVGSSVICGAFGYSGYIRIWDPRSGEVVWETNEPGSSRSSRFGDSFADVDVDPEELTLFKICSKSGDLAMADLRSLKEDPWIYMKDKNPALINPSSSGSNTVIHCYKGQVFVGRDGELEVWSKPDDRGSQSRTQSGNQSSVEVEMNYYRRNYVDKVEDAERGVINMMKGGGQRLFVSRENVEGIEVWETSDSSGAISVLSLMLSQEVCAASDLGATPELKERFLRTNRRDPRYASGIDGWPPPSRLEERAT